ncbi:MAG: dephospho-CoA kinase [Streptococcus sp.]|nr:dephospho-CoA kinase [Streptococcus sp.]
MLGKKVIGLTGGIASGKTTVANYLTERGFPVIDADAVVHELQKKDGKLYRILVEFFGLDILQDDLEINRQKLADLIFSLPDGLELSSKLQDTIIRQELWKKKEELLKKYDIIFLDIPLLFEKHFEKWFDIVVLVYVPESIQCQRLMIRNHLSEIDAKVRISSQLSIEEKKHLSDVVIDNQFDFSKTKIQLQDFLDKICYNNQGNRKK